MIKKKFCIVSSSRADLGIMRNLIKKMQKIKNIKTDLVLTGGHLSKKFGNSKKEIIENKIKPNCEIKIPLLNNNSLQITQSSNVLLKKISEKFAKTKYDLIVLFGDRFEIFISAYAATIFKIPIAHLSGGDETIGSYDNQFRNAITKLAHVHFPTNNLSKRRIIQMGENPKNVFNYGSLSIENVKNTRIISKKELEKKFNLKFKEKNFVVTLHPETLGDLETKKIKKVFNVIKKFKNIFFIFTASNQDERGDKINTLISKFVKKNHNTSFVRSFGQTNLFNIYNIVDGVIGNSSSGVHEAPIFKIGTLNLGSRQQGRLGMKSIININFNEKKIEKGIKKILSKNFKKKINKLNNPYYKRNSSELIIKKLKFILKNKNILNKKFNQS